MRLDIDHLRGWIGREDHAAEILSSDLVLRFDAMLDRTSDTAPGTVAPRMIHYCLCQPVAPTAQLGEDGHPARGGFLPPVPLQRRMWAGGTLDFLGEIRIGETVERLSRVADVVAKEGRSGILCFVTLEHSYASDGRPVLTERQNIVYRSASGEEGNKTVPSPEAMATYSRRITPTPPLLFRYSALTYNGHRIHYDVPYARKVEGYPGLVVHGPLQATVIAHFAEDIHGKPPARLTVRARSPIFDTEDFIVNAHEDGKALAIWTAANSGRVAMEARAEW